MANKIEKLSDIKLEDLCNDNIICSNYQCELIHPRCCSGICIQGIKEDEDQRQCSKNECKLKHITLDEFENYQVNERPILGVYRFNICPNINNICNQQQNKTCQYLHPQWMQNKCFININKKCKVKDCKYQHITWNDLEEQLHKQYSIIGIHPENICQKTNCKCEKHLQNTQQCCIPYFKGFCPFLECSKNHYLWENFKSNFGNLQEYKLQPCIKQNSQIIQKGIKTVNDDGICIDKQEMKRINDIIKKQNIVDVIFIMDCTKTMDKWIEQQHNSIAIIIDNFKKVIQGYSLRVAFVGYRDVEVQRKKENNYEVEILNSNHVVFHDFTHDVEKIKQFIKKQKAQGGGDEAEDVIAGLQKATELNISSNPQSILITFLFAEAPCHGKQYHDIEDDDQMETVEQGTLEKMMEKYKKLKQENHFICINIKKTTEKMYTIMKQEFQDGFIISELSNPENLEQIVGFYLSTSYTKSQLKIKQTKQQSKITIEAGYNKTKYVPYDLTFNKQQKIEFWTKFPEMLASTERTGFTSIEIYNHIYYNIYLSQNINLTYLVQQEPEIIDVSIDGVVSNIFRLFDVTNNREMVAKIPKTLVAEYKLNGQVSQEEIKKAMNQAQSRYYTQSYAKQMAKCYREKTLNIEGAPPIFYASPILYKLKQQFYGLDVIYAETYINLPNLEWIKYTNNKNFTNPLYSFYSTYSHFTYQESGELFLISDLQGKKNILSDPSIHTQVEFNKILFEDDLNLKKEGICEFFNSQHYNCSVICQKLCLPLNEQNNNSCQFDNTQWKLEESESIFVVCENCDEFRELTQSEYKNDKLYEKCKSCNLQEKEIYEIQCVCCKIIFNAPLNFQQRIGTINNKCLDCKQQCFNNQLIKQCIYCGIKCNVKNTEIDIQQNKYVICVNGKQYLNTLTCQICQEKYQFDQFLNQQQYLKGEFICLACNK